MTINELKAIIKLGHGDRIVVRNDNYDVVEYDGSETVNALKSYSDWDGNVHHNICI